MKKKIKDKTDIQYLTEFVLKASTDRKVLLALERAAMEADDYGVVYRLRDMDKQLFSPTKEAKIAKEKAQSAHTALAMCGVNVKEMKVCWTIMKAMEGFLKMGGNFSCNEAATIQHNCEKIFG